MVSNFDEKSLRTVLPEGKRHYHCGKKTSLFGSESPKNDKTRNYKSRLGNPNNIFGSGEEEFLNQHNAIKESMKLSSDQEKRETLEELQRYNPWGKPGAGAPNSIKNMNNSNRANWEYEQELKASDEARDNVDESFPGFMAGFGSGNTGGNSRRRSDISQNSSDGKPNNGFIFGSQGGSPSAPGSNYQGPTVTIHKQQQNQDEAMQKKYEETKAMADNLEKEIQLLKLKQMENKYPSTRVEQNPDYAYQDERDQIDKLSLNYEDDALYREAENRARLRDLDRLKESYDREYSEAESNFINQNEAHPGRENGDSMMNDNLVSYNQQHPINAKKESVSINRNDYRPYTHEEYMNCRPQMYNHSLNKRTTLSGSEEKRSNYNSNNNYSNNDLNYNNNSNMQLIDEDKLMKKFSKSNTHGNLFPSERNYSPGQNPNSYQTKAPYATD